MSGRMTFKSAAYLIGEESVPGEDVPQKLETRPKLPVHKGRVGTVRVRVRCLRNSVVINL